MNAARDWTARRYLRLHLVRVGHRPAHGVDVQAAVHVAVLGYRPPLVPLDRFTRPRKERLGGLARGAVLADAEGLALAVSRLVRLARLVGDTVRRDVFVNLSRVTSLAAASGSAIDEHLWSEDRLRERGFARDFDAI